MNKYKIFGLLVTDGERDISKSLESMKMQTRQLEQILIASEKEIASEFRVYVNNDKNGLAINTTQALNKIWIDNFPIEEKLFIATLDDDDAWDGRYIEKAERLILEGANFITGCISIVRDGENIGTECPMKNKSPNFYIYDNDGVQGSNKIFDLELALQNGGMFKTINSSTDRVINTNLLSDERTVFSSIGSIVAIQNRDSDRKRITNDPTRIENLREFYRVNWNKIDKDKIKSINKRHKDLHGFEEVITW